MELERQTLGTWSDEQRTQMLDRLAAIEKQVISRKMPGSHAEQVYILREHIDFVRKKLTGETTQPVHMHRSSEND
jgi:hypothetical protein